MDDESDSPEAIKLFEDNDYIIAGDNGGGDSLIYFIKEKFFMEWCHECPFKDGHVDLSQKLRYQDLMNIAKEEFTPKNNNSVADQYAKAAIAADANLGYYRLSKPPAGVKPLKL